VIVDFLSPCEGAQRLKQSHPTAKQRSTQTLKVSSPSQSLVLLQPWINRCLDERRKPLGSHKKFNEEQSFLSGQGCFMETNN
jgi:hypothetical protein